MHIVLWVISVVLAVVFLGAGTMKLVSPKDKLVHSGQAWAENFSASGIKAIGLVEILGAVGLIVPPLMGVAPVLVPLAAAGVVILMVGAAVVHLRRTEYTNIGVNVVLLLLALSVAVLRFGPYAF